MLAQGAPLRWQTIGICVPEDCPPKDVPLLLRDQFGLHLEHLYSTHCQPPARWRAGLSGGAPLSSKLLRNHLL